MKYQSYSSYYEQSVIDLLNICFTGKRITPVSFRWKHFDTFFNNKEIAMIGVEHNSVCAFVCFTPVNIVRAEKEYSFYSCAVQATHPNYRRHGIVSELTKLIERSLPDDINYLGFSNDNGIKIDLHSKRINYTIVGQMKRACVLSLPYSTKLTINKTNMPNYFISDCNYFYFKKDQNYINWRYINNPKNTYDYFEVLEGDKRVGWVVFKQFVSKYEIVDIFVSDTNKIQECIKAIANYAFSHLIPVCTYTFLPNTFWDSVFPVLSVGKKIGMFFTVKSLNKDLLNQDKWLIQGGDIQ